MSTPWDMDCNYAWPACPSFAMKLFARSPRVRHPQGWGMQLRLATCNTLSIDIVQPKEIVKKAILKQTHRKQKSHLNGLTYPITDHLS